MSTVRRTAPALAAGLCALALLTGGCDAASEPVAVDLSALPGASVPPSDAPDSSSGAAERRARTPLAGKVVVLDPGHQLGNARHPRQINRPVPAGGFRKACNTTGTATNRGYPEATFAWRVAKALQHRLERAGARVQLTRHSNSRRRWGPCVDVRGRAGNPGRPGPTADLKLSLHGDGSTAAGARGFHVIRPAVRRPWTTDIAKPSRRLAVITRNALAGAGFPTANYTARRGIDVRGDLGTLNLSDVPTVMAELGNMRNARDAARMTSARGQRAYAAALALAVRRYLR